MSEYERRSRSQGDQGRYREDSSDRWAEQNYRKQSDQRQSDRTDRYSGQDGRTNGGRDRSSYEPPRHDNDHDVDGRNMWTRSVDEVRSWFGDDEAERRRLHDEESRMRNERREDDYSSRTHVRDSHDRYARGKDADRPDRGSAWDSSRGYGSNIDGDYGRNDGRTGRADRTDGRFFSSSNEYGGSRNRDNYRDYPTHNPGRSRGNTEGDEMNYSYQNRSGSDHGNSSSNERLFGGREYERNYPTRAERNDEHPHELSDGWQSNDSHRGYRSLNNTGRVGIDQDNQLGRQRYNSPNEHDQNYSKGDYHVNLNAGGQEYNSRHYEQRGRMGTQINDYAQRGYSEGYGRTGYSLNQSGNYANGEVRSGRHPKNYKGADERIYVEVCEALGRELDASDIEVTSSGSEITLTGNVRSRDEKRLAERIAERVHGVEDVHNRLVVKGESSDAGGTGQSTDRSATQPGSSSRTDLASDGSSSTGISNGSGSGSSSGSGSGSSNGSSSKTAGSNGSGRSGARK